MSPEKAEFEGLTFCGRVIHVRGCDTFGFLFLDQSGESWKLAFVVRAKIMG